MGPPGHWLTAGWPYSVWFGSSESGPNSGEPISEAGRRIASTSNPFSQFKDLPHPRPLPDPSVKFTDSVQESRKRLKVAVGFQNIFLSILYLEYRLFIFDIYIFDVYMFVVRLLLHVLVCAGIGRQEFVLELNTTFSPDENTASIIQIRIYFSAYIL